MDIRERMQQLMGDYAGTENLRIVDVEFLKEIEWGGCDDTGHQRLAVCPACGRMSGGKAHFPGCKLAALIGEGNDGDQR